MTNSHKLDSIHHFPLQAHVSVITQATQRLGQNQGAHSSSRDRGASAFDETFFKKHI